LSDGGAKRGRQEESIDLGINSGTLTLSGDLGKECRRMGKDVQGLGREISQVHWSRENGREKTEPARGKLRIKKKGGSSGSWEGKGQ